MITSVDFDYYGSLLVNGNKNGVIKLHIKNDNDGSWSEFKSFKGHDSSITSMNFCHPSFGKLLATSSIDRTIKIWDFGSNNDFNLIAKLVDNKSVLSKIEFSSSQNLLLYSICSDGTFKIYQCTIPTDPTTWSIMHHLHLPVENKNNIDNDNLTFTLTSCRDRRFSNYLSIISGDTSIANIYTYSSINRPNVIGRLDAASSITSISWAPNCDRPYHLIAVGLTDGYVKIFKVTLPNQLNDDQFKSECIAELEHGGTVKSVDWNVIGTVLSSSSDDGKVIVWKSSYTGLWSNHSTYTVVE